MDVKEAVEKAKSYIADVLANEGVANLALEETEHEATSGRWIITISLSLPWNTPRTRAQEVLEQMGAISSLRRSYKVISMSEDGEILSMKNRPMAEASD